MEELNNQILQIAYKMRPNINRPMMEEKNRSEWMDLLKCAILKKYEDNKEIEKIIWDLEVHPNISAFVTDQIEEWTITYWEVKPHTHWWKKKGLCTDNYNDNIILCNNKRQW